MSLLKGFWYVVNLKNNPGFSSHSHSDIPLLGGVAAEPGCRNFPFYFGINIPVWVELKLLKNYTLANSSWSCIIRTDQCDGFAWATNRCEPPRLVYSYRHTVFRRISGCEHHIHLSADIQNRQGIPGSSTHACARNKGLYTSHFYVNRIRPGFFYGSIGLDHML